MYNVGYLSIVHHIIHYGLFITCIRYKIMVLLDILIIIQTG